MFFVLAAIASQVTPTVWAPADRTTGADYTCATVFDPSSNITQTDHREAETWIAAFWSGLNIGRNAAVGAGSDQAGIIGEVRLYCQSHPSDQLPNAVLQAWRNLHNSHPQ